MANTTNKWAFRWTRSLENLHFHVAYGVQVTIAYEEEKEKKVVKNEGNSTHALGLGWYIATRLGQAILMAYLDERLLTWQKHRHLLSSNHSPLRWRKSTIYHVQPERIFNTVSTFIPYSISKEGGKRENDNGRDKMTHRAPINHSNNFLHYDTILRDCNFWFCLLMSRQGHFHSTVVKIWNLSHITLWYKTPFTWHQQTLLQKFKNNFCRI